MQADVTMSELQLSPEDANFLLAQTGFQDVASLKSHILKVQSKAAEVRKSSYHLHRISYQKEISHPSLKVFPYPCIRRFDFIRRVKSVLRDVHLSRKRKKRCDIPRHWLLL